MFPANMYVIRPATDLDADALHRLAELDGRTPLEGEVLVAQKDRVIQAALSLDDRRSVANPFHPTADPVTLLRMRADALRAVQRTPSLARRLLTAVATPRSAATPA
jgi:hypothetical protein